MKQSAEEIQWKIIDKQEEAVKKEEAEMELEEKRTADLELRRMELKLQLATEERMKVEAEGTLMQAKVQLQVSYSPDSATVCGAQNLRIYNVVVG